MRTQAFSQRASVRDWLQSDGLRISVDRWRESIQKRFERCRQNVNASRSLAIATERSIIIPSFSASTSACAKPEQLTTGKRFRRK
ncbi:hypothetical protein R1flu_002000 [Riccia fluitans]|uniref:Ribosomal protein S14 n=1 Tax=Riccia fluitans TaxID=41844 RepID=A0ABD1Y4V9_9MARC